MPKVNIPCNIALGLPGGERIELKQGEHDVTVEVQKALIAEGIIEKPSTRKQNEENPS